MPGETGDSTASKGQSWDNDFFALWSLIVLAYIAITLSLTTTGKRICSKTCGNFVFRGIILLVGVTFYLSPWWVGALAVTSFLVNEALLG